MGCDIHSYKEKKVGSKWVTADKGWQDEYNEGLIDVPWENRFTDRDYVLFGLLANVRRDSGFNQEPKGIPFNVCSEIKNINEQLGSDGHSHSFFYLTELIELWELLESKKVTITGMKDKNQIQKLKESLASDDPDYSLLYPYCQSTNADNYEDFEVEIPASIQLDGLKKIIDSFDTADGELQRIIFWFDN